jgi:hypothetical protein
MFHEMIAGVEAQLRKSLPDRTDDAETADGNASADLVGALVKALRATADSGHLDAAAQFVRQPQGSFVLVGGISLVDAGTLSGAMGDLLTRFKANENVSNVRLNVLTHEGIAIHRLEFKQDRPQEERFYGGKPGLYVGVGEDAVWFAFGGADAPTELKRAIDLAAEPIPEGVTQSPFQFVMNFASWMDVFDPDQKAEGFAALARGSFAKGKDALRMEALPIDDGLRLRITMDEAFLRLVGEQIARQFDANSE